MYHAPALSLLRIIRHPDIRRARRISSVICSRIIENGLTKRFQRYLLVNNVNNIDKKSRKINAGKVSPVPVFLCSSVHKESVSLPTHALYFPGFLLPSPSPISIMSSSDTSTGDSHLLFRRSAFFFCRDSHSLHFSSYFFCRSSR